MSPFIVYLHKYLQQITLVMTFFFAFASSQKVYILSDELSEKYQNLSKEK